MDLLPGCAPATNREAALIEVERQKSKRKMSNRVAERLHAREEEGKLNKAGEHRFANAISLIQPTLENLQRLIERCSGYRGNLERRTYKLLYWLHARGYRLGHELATPEAITLLSNLVAEELKISAPRFEAVARGGEVACRPEISDIQWSLDRFVALY